MHQNAMRLLTPSFVLIYWVIVVLFFIWRKGTSYGNMKLQNGRQPTWPPWYLLMMTTKTCSTSFSITFPETIRSVCFFWQRIESILRVFFKNHILINVSVEIIKYFSFHCLILKCRFENPHDGPSTSGGISWTRSSLREYIHNPFHDPLLPAD